MIFVLELLIKLLLKVLYLGFDDVLFCKYDILLVSIIDFSLINELSIGNLQEFFI